MKIPDDVRRKIQDAFHAADNLMRAQPEEFHNRLADIALRWAINQYLPSSSYFNGIYAYAVHPDDMSMTGGLPVEILHVKKQFVGDMELSA